MVLVAVVALAAFGLVHVAGGSPSAHASPIPSVGLVERSSGGPAGSGGWSIMLLSSWRQAPSCSQPDGSSGACSSQDAGRSTEVWYDPANSGRRLTVVTCRDVACAAAGTGGSPLFPPRITATVSTQVMAPGRFAFTLAPGADPAAGPYRIDGLYAARLSGSALRFPVYTVLTSLPDSVHWLATDILDSFTMGAPAPG